MKRSCLRCCCFFLVLSVLAGLLPGVTVSAGDPFAYEIVNGEAIITAYNGTEEVVTVPDTLEGVPVTGIGALAFEDAPAKELILPDSVTAIADGAFYACKFLEKIHLGNSLVSLGEGAFADCFALVEVILPATLQTMGTQVFSGCKALTLLAVEEGCEAFSSAGNCIIDANGVLVAGCSTSVIPADGSVLAIAPYAFSFATGLTEVSIPEGVTEIGEGAFENTGLTTLFIPDTVTKVGKHILHGTKLVSLYCGSASQPVDWHIKWNFGLQIPVIWGYDNTCAHGETRHEALDPTCTAEGFEKLVCNLCNSTLTLKLFPSIGHTEKTETVAPTCAKAGYIRVTCTVCEKELSYTTLSPTASHGELREEVLEPTCCEEGYRVQICTVCDRVVTSATYPPLGHNEYTETVMPTCASDGYTRVTCLDCGEEVSYAVLPAISTHGELRTEVLDPTCTEKGYRKEICTVCEKVLSNRTLPALGHKEHTETVAPTCIATGFTRVTCTVCEKELSYTLLPIATEHAHLQTERVEPTCTEAGFQKVTCALCGIVTLDEVLPPTGHTEETETVEPTCIAAGYTRVTCSVCKIELSYTELPMATEHAHLQTERVEPTCTEAGYEKVTCALCGIVTLDEVLPPTGHTEETETVDPTCVSPGYTRVTCSVCKAELSYTEISPLPEHPSFRTERAEPTCTEAGYEKAICTLCGEVVTETELPPTGHTEETETVNPTCAVAGYIRVTCTVCNAEISYTELPVTEEHASVHTETKAPTCTLAGSQTSTCTLCGKVLQSLVLPALGHTYETTTLRPTCGMEGYTLVACSVCGDQKSYTVLPRTTHTQGADGRCTYCGVASGNPEADFTYTLGPYGLVITGYVGTSTKVAIPAYIKGGPVTAIASGAFAGKNITEVQFPDTLREIGKFAFEDCTALTELLIPGSVKLIDEGAFLGCTGVSSLYLSEGVESILYAAFAGCGHLSSVTLPASLKTLSYGAFGNCSSLRRLQVREGNTVFASAGNCVYEQTTGLLLAGCVSSVIPDDGRIKSIAQGAFEGFGELTSLYIPEGITSIGAYAFRGTGLTELTLPSSVEQVGRYILFDTPTERIYCSPEEKPAGWHDNWIAGSAAQVNWNSNACVHEESVLLREIPSDCMNVGSRIYGCATCGAVTETEVLPVLAHTYSKGVCSACGYVDGLILEPWDGGYRILGYTGTEKVLVIPAQVAGIPVLAIDSRAFAENLLLKTVYVPSSVVCIGEEAFADCENLAEIRCQRDAALSTWHRNWASHTDAAFVWSADLPAAPAVLYGDINGDGRITTLDYAMLKRYVMKKLALTETQLLGADANRDGRVNALDYALLKRHVLKTYVIKQDG